ncbi:MAG: hypothetical protein ACTSP4_17390 [Candidatus Hodarchaeales archaeon]
MITLKTSKMFVLVLFPLVLMTLSAANGYTSPDNVTKLEATEFEPYQFIIFGDTRNTPEGENDGVEIGYSVHSTYRRCS